MPENDLQQLFARLASPTALTQLVLIAVAALAGVVASHFARGLAARAASCRAARPGRRGLPKAPWSLPPAFTAMVMLLIGRGSLEFTDMTPTLIDIALQLAAALLIVRLALYLLRLALGPHSWVHRWETRLTFILWLLLGFSLLGWFDFVEIQPRRHGPGARQDTVHPVVSCSRESWWSPCSWWPPAWCRAPSRRA